MSHRLHTWYTLINKVLSVISIVLALFLIVDCSYIIVNANKENIGNYTSHMDETGTDDPGSMSKTYNIIIKVTSAIAICVAACQFFMSLIMSLSCSNKAGIAMKIWISVHLLAFAILLFCILLPGFYPRGNGKVHNIDLKEIHNVSKDLQNLWQDKTMYLTYYFLGLIINAVFLLIFLTFTCCCLRCGQYEYDQLK